MGNPGLKQGPSYWIRLLNKTSSLCNREAHDGLLFVRRDDLALEQRAQSLNDLDC